MVEASPHPLSQMPSHLMNNIMAVTTRWDSWTGVVAKVRYVFLLSHWSRGSAINRALSGISVENTHYHVHIYFTPWTRDVPPRDFQTRLCTVPSIFVLGLTVQRYSASVSVDELYLLGAIQMLAAWRGVSMTTTRRRDWAGNWSGQLRDGQRLWWQQDSQQCVHLGDAE